MEYYQQNVSKINKIQNHFKYKFIELTCYDYRLAKLGFTYD